VRRQTERRAGTETISLSDASAVRIASLISSRPDAVTISDAASVNLAQAVIHRTEQVFISDSATVEIGKLPDINISRSESVSVVDNAESRLALLRIHGTDEISIQESIFRGMDYLEIYRLDSVSISDESTRDLHDAYYTIWQTEQISVEAGATRELSADEISFKLKKLHPFIFYSFPSFKMKGQQVFIFDAFPSFKMQSRKVYYTQ